jgi:citrate synthase
MIGCNSNVADIGFELIKQIKSDEWFNEKLLFPNVDFWVALFLDTLDFPLDMIPVWEFIPRYQYLL